MKDNDTIEIVSESGKESSKKMSTSQKVLIGVGVAAAIAAAGTATYFLLKKNNVAAAPVSISDIIKK